MPFIDVRDLRVHYQIRGEGPRLLVISGTGGDLRRTPGIFESPLCPRFEILAYDQRGLGQTSIPAAPCSMADFADDAAALLEALGWGPCRVLGISFGGMVAQELALRHPQRVSRLALACTSSGGAGGASYPLHELHGLPLEAHVHRSLEIGDTRRHADWRAANPDKYQTLFEQTLAMQRIGADEPGRALGARRQLEARARHDTWDRLPELRMPVYLCGGRYDGIAPPANLERMRERIPGSILELFEGGHPFLQQDRAAFPRLADFLSDGDD